MVLTQRVRRLEEAKAAAREAEHEAGMRALGALSDADLDARYMAGAASSVAEWEGEHGPVPPRSWADLGIFPGRPGWERVLRKLPDAEMIALLKHDLLEAGAYARGPLPCPD